MIRQSIWCVAFTALFSLAHSAGLEASTQDTDLTDAHILALFDQVNAIDVWVGRLGQGRGSPEVRDLARTVVRDHEGVQRATRELADRLGIAPVPPAGDQTAREMSNILARLHAVGDEGFDEAYLAQEVLFHAKAITTVRKTLIPAVQNVEIREFFESLIPAFEGHLQMTKDVARRKGFAIPPMRNPEAVFTPAHAVQYDEAIPGTVWFGTVFGDRTSGRHGSMVKLPRGAATPPHSHSGDYYAVIISGVIENPTPSNEAVPVQLTQGSYYSIPGNVDHITRCADNSPTDCMLFLVQDASFDFVPTRH